MLFRREFHAGLRDGSITLSFRLWSRPRVKAGRRYRCPPIGLIQVDAVERVAARQIRPRDARRAGFADRAALLDYLARLGSAPLEEDAQLYRVALHWAGPDERTRLAAAALGPGDVEALAERLARMDARSRHGPWTMQTLALIRSRPRVAASRLAADLGRETRPFKADVRKLKGLGLTCSCEVGYELSPRGRELLERSGR